RYWRFACCGQVRNSRCPALSTADDNYLTRYLHAHRHPPPDQVREPASVENALPRQLTDPAEDRGSDRSRLLRQQGMAGLWYHHHRDAFAEFFAHLVCCGTGFEGIERPLKVEQGRRASRPPFRLLGRAACRRLDFVRGRMPTLKPNTCVAIRGEE